jgi:cytochrome c-type biogenesis protein CcmH/NrfF
MPGARTRTSKKRLCQLAALFAMVVAFLGAGDDSFRINQLGHEMICMCGCNYLLLECNHLHCPYLGRMRDELTAAVGRGDSDSSILQAFVQNYGAVVLAAPTKTGFNRVAWIMPYAALAGGILLVAFIVRAWRGKPLAIHASVPARIRGEELREYREQARRETEV